MHLARVIYELMYGMAIKISHSINHDLSADDTIQPG